ncbi:MAG: UDP-2,4-diacetamido-2,4,6-trideoxy-beta-L-altropyranose hydrolase [Thiobacillaceae bacterium]
MRIAFRADASITIGSGHVMRCLTLADQMRAGGAETCFVCRACTGHMGEIISRHGHAVHWLPDTNPDQSPVEAEDAAHTLDLLAKEGRWDWVAVDHYGLAAGWEHTMRAIAARIMVIDDLADRAHDCDLLLDQNLQEPDRYRGLVPAGCLQLLGPRYALLRPQFAARRQGLRRRDGQVKRVLVFFGGTDPSGETLKALAALRQIGRQDLCVDVVLGHATPHRASVEAACREMPSCTLHCQVEEMAALVAAADLCIGAGGSASWERCCLGLPAIVLATADNQVVLSEILAQAGAQRYLGPAATVSPDRLTAEIIALFTQPESLISMSVSGMKLVDGLGAERVSARMVA